MFTFFCIDIRLDTNIIKEKKHSKLINIVFSNISVLKLLNTILQLRSVGDFHYGSSSGVIIIVIS